MKLLISLSAVPLSMAKPYMALGDKDHNVRTLAAQNPNATEANLNKALDDEAEEVRIEAAQNPNATRETLEKALGDKNKFVKFVAAKRLKGD